MKNHQIQTRAELPNRRSKDFSLKSPSDEAKKPQKITKKNLKIAFDSVNCSVESTPTLDCSDDILQNESTESILLGNLNSPSLSESSTITSVTADLTSSAELFALDGDEMSELCSNLENQHEVEMMVRNFKKASTDPRFKKVLDALVEVKVKEFCSLPDNTDWMDKLFSDKICILLMCFLMCMIACSVILLLGVRVGGLTYYPPPT